MTEIDTQSIFDNTTKIHLETVHECLDNIPTGSSNLYHYTSLDTARKILESGKLRFTNMMYLNDPNEIREGLDLAKTVLWARIERLIAEDKQHIAQLLAAPFLHLLVSLTPRSNRNHQRDGLLEQYVKWFGKDITNSYETFWQRDWQIYICCLSERSDSLRQWLPYAEDGKGTAIGFKGIEGETHQIGPNPILRVCYAPNEEKERYLNTLLDRLFKYYEDIVQVQMAHYKGDFSQSPIAAFLVSVTDALIQDIVACKNPHYEDEQEWRMYYFRDDGLFDEDAKRYPKFFVRNGVIKPYYEFEYTAESLVDIKLGPQANFELNRNALELLLEKNGMTNCSVSKSDAQYRG